jgi:alkylation response protein AidB-like acyl-CoA dehydrogenase
MIAGAERELLAQVLTRATAAATGPALDEVLRDIAWHEALTDDAPTAISLLFELQGRFGVASSALDAVLANAIGGDASTDVAVVLPPIGRTSAPGRSTADGIEIHGLGTLATPHASVALVACDDTYMAVATDELTLRPISGLDPALGLVDVTATSVRAADLPGASSGAWPVAVGVGQLAIAHELIGASRAMLQLARDHAVERVQFGQPISNFQAVRHRLADAFVAVESANAATEAAWEDGSTLASAAAKAIAGRNAQVVARHAQQVLAGIGFTAEHPLHRYVRRVLVLDGILGDARSLTRSMGADLLRTRHIPPLVPL